MEQLIDVKTINIDNILDMNTQKKRFNLFKKKKNDLGINTELKNVLECILINQNKQAQELTELSNKFLLLENTDSITDSITENNTVIDIEFEELKPVKFEDTAKNTTVRLYPEIREKLEELYKMYPDYNRQDILNHIILEGYNKYKKI